jgi:hypothetical protein
VFEEWSYEEEELTGEFAVVFTLTRRSIRNKLVLNECHTLISNIAVRNSQQA